MARKRLAWSELRVGMLVVTSFSILTLLIILISGKAGFFTPTYTLKTYMPSAAGLKRGSLVWLAGIECGSVKDVNITNQKDPAHAVEVILRVSQEYQNSIRSNSVASIGSLGLLGDKYLDISRGSAEFPAIPPYGEIKNSSEADIRKIIQNSNDLVANLGDLVDKINSITSKIDQGKGTVGKFINDPSLYNQLSTTVTNSNEIVAKLKSGEGTLGKLIYDPELYDHMNNTLANVDSLISRVNRGEGTLGMLLKDKGVFEKTDALLAKFNTVADRIEKGEGFLGKMSKDETLYTELKDSVSKINQLMDRVNRGEGTLGKLANDDSLYNNINTASAEIVKLLYDFRQNPKRFLHIKVGLF
jgi:phospholipid/cholesterol/gamma-HCH transport system substrate-binding protein